MIKKDMTFAKIMEEKPDSAAIFFKYGMHCMGCHMSGSETLEQGCRAHGMDDKQIDKLVEEINALK